MFGFEAGCANPGARPPIKLSGYASVFNSTRLSYDNVIIKPLIFRYLLELFLEALCIEWSLLICIMLKDSSYISRLLRACRSSPTNRNGEESIPLDTLQRTRDCLVQIDQWAVAEW